VEENHTVLEVHALPTTYELRPGEREGMPYWEICFPPVSLIANKT